MKPKPEPELNPEDGAGDPAGGSSDHILEKGAGGDSGSPAATMAPEKSLFQRYLQIFGVVTLYWFVSIAMVFVNKTLLSGQASLDAPLFITWSQCVVTVASCYALTSLNLLVPVRVFSFPKLTLCLDTMKKVLPLSVIFVAMIIFNNLCLKYVGVSFYYISRSLTTVFNVALTFLVLGERTSPMALLCCGTIVLGFYLGVDEEGVSGTLSVLGTLYGVLASLFVSLNAIFYKRALPAVGNDVWLLTFYNNVNGVILFVPLMAVFGEMPVVMGYENLFGADFLCLMLVGGIFGFGIGYVTGLQVKYTSPLTHNISGTAKAAAQTVIATQWYGEIKTGMWWFSNGVVLFGSAAYARVRQLEMAKNVSIGSSKEMAGAADLGKA